MLIRKLDPTEAPLVARFYREAPDYWLLAEGRCDPDRQAAEFFTDGPPGSDLSLTHHLGLFLSPEDLHSDSGRMGTSPPPRGEGRGVGGTGEDTLRLSGVAELSYGFPEPTDAYLGLMMLGPWAQGAGHGKAFLAEAERLARTRNAPRLYLAVLEANPRARAFWEREGFAPTGLSGSNADTGHRLHRLVKAL